MTKTTLQEKEFVLMYTLLKIIEKYSLYLFETKQEYQEAGLFKKLQMFNEHKHSINLNIEKCLSIPVLLLVNSAYKNELIEFWGELVPMEKVFQVKDLKEYIESNRGQFKTILYFENDSIGIQEDFCMIADDFSLEQSLKMFLETKNLSDQTTRILIFIDNSVEALYENNHIKFIVRNQSLYIRWFPRLRKLHDAYSEYFQSGNILQQYTVIKEQMLGWIRYSLSKNIPRHAA